MKRSIKKVKDDFVKLARMTQPALKNHLRDVLDACGYDVIDGDGYLYGRGDVVLLTAHLDTVHVKPVKKVYTQTYFDDVVISSPQGIGGDDRCGVWAVLDVIPRLLSRGVRPAVLFCEDEEIGGVGSAKFCETPYIEELTALRYLIEIDRKGDNDAVFYDDSNRKFQKYITETTGYKLAYGSFSDISHLCPACGRSGVNLSSGYYNPHTTSEYVVASEMAHTADVIVKLVLDTIQNDVPAFDYEDAYTGYGAFLRYGTDISGAVFYYTGTDGIQKEDWIDAYTFSEAVGEFLMAHPSIPWADVLDYELF